MGTLIFLDRIFERLQANLCALGLPLPSVDVEFATRREFAYYIAHSSTAHDTAALQQLRLDCAGVLLAALRERGHAPALSREQMASALIGALEFRLFPDVLPALTALHERGTRLGMISNWDCSLPGIVGRLGLGDLLDVVAVSAICGCEKPDPRIFQEALRQAAAAPSQALHIGDSFEKDVLGAHAAGMPAVLLRREPGEAAPPDVPAIASLSELPSLW